MLPSLVSLPCVASSIFLPAKIDKFFVWDDGNIGFFNVCGVADDLTIKSSRSKKK
jgi:hypothetical protein